MVKRIVELIEVQVDRDMKRIKAIYKYGVFYNMVNDIQKRLANNINSLVEWRKFL